MINMVVENITQLLPQSVIEEISTLATLFKAVGGLIIAYIIFHTINIFWNKKRLDEFRGMKKVLDRMDRRLRKIEKKIVKK